MRTIVLPDIHGEPGPLNTALEAAGCLKRAGQWTLDPRKKFALLTLGDTTGRGKQNRKVMEVMLRLRQQLGPLFTMLVGNHCIAREIALREGGMEQILRWMEGSNTSIIAEFGKTRGCRVRNGTTAFTDFFKKYPPSEDDNKRWNALTQKHPELLERDFQKSLLAAKQFFTRKDVAALFDNARLVHPMGDVLAAHAGINLIAAELLRSNGVNGVNLAFRECINKNDLQAVASGDLSGVTWMRRDQESGRLLDPTISDTIKYHGFQALIRGHDAQSDGRQRVAMENGILEIDADTDMWQWNASFVEVDDDTGRIRTWNQEQGWRVVRAAGWSG
jgi:hypothetical protein